MVPDTYVCLDSLPLTSSGKVDRAALPAPFGAARPRQVAAPRGPVEERLAGIVSELLTLERVGIDEDFFLLGGHSLLGAQLITRVRDAYGVDLTLQALFDNPTVEAMAMEVERLIVERLESLTDAEARRPALQQRIRQLVIRTMDGGCRRPCERTFVQLQGDGGGGRRWPVHGVMNRLIVASSSLNT